MNYRSEFHKDNHEKGVKSNHHEILNLWINDIFKDWGETGNRGKR